MSFPASAVKVTSPVVPEGTVAVICIVFTVPSNVTVVLSAVAVIFALPSGVVTVILLSSYRCTSTSIFKYFQNGCISN